MIVLAVSLDTASTISTCKHIGHTEFIRKHFTKACMFLLMRSDVKKIHFDKQAFYINVRKICNSCNKHVVCFEVKKKPARIKLQNTLRMSCQVRQSAKRQLGQDPHQDLLFLFDLLSETFQFHRNCIRCTRLRQNFVRYRQVTSR